MSEMYADLIAAQAAFPSIHKGKTADTGKFKYSYADLGDIADKVLPVLHENKFALIQGFRDGGLFTKLLHASGGEIDFGTLPVSNNPDPQKVGSAITYMRRYSLCAALGIVADDDDDGAAAKEKPKQDNAPRQTAPDEAEPPFDPQACFTRIRDGINHVVTNTALDTLLRNESSNLKRLSRDDFEKLKDQATKRRAALEKAA